MNAHFAFQPVDQAMAEDAAIFAPEAVFDVHAHLYRKAGLTLPPEGPLAGGPEEAVQAAWRDAMARHLPGKRLAGGLFFAFPAKGLDRAAANDWVVAQCESSPESRVLVVAAPGDGPGFVEAALDTGHVAGLKPYHVWAAVENTFEARVTDYAPEWMWELADARGLVLMLHLVRRRALADTDNLRDLERLCGAYPRAKVMLAHAGRGFHGPDTVEGLERLGDLPNVWFDTSAVCESLPLTAIIGAVGPRRLMYGSDYPVSELRGRPVTTGDGFRWLHPETLAGDGGPACAMALCGQESLRALGEAARLLGLNEDDLRDIFCDNARRMLGLAAPGGNLTQERYAEAKQRIPGGVQLLSKRPEQMAPGQWPAYFREARGCNVWDLDGRRYTDMSTNGIGSCLLGYREPHVAAAVRRRVMLGAMSTLNPPEEVDLAERLCALHPWAEQVRFARTGGEIAAVAVRIARATTGRSLVAVCGYHGWHDWYLAANLGASGALDGHLLPGLEPTGVPRELHGTALTFPYNDSAAFDRIVAEHGDRLAAVVMEPCRYRDPAPGFLEHVREAARQSGALLVFDEITIGFRLHCAGAHLRFGIEPDLAIYAKALGSGHPVAAVLGTAAAMDGAHRSFISSTYWTESVGPVAALATLDRLAAVDVPAHVAAIGVGVQRAWREAAKRHGLPVKVDDGYPCLAHFAFDHPDANVLRTLYTRWMLERGFLAGTAIYPTLAHTPEHVAAYAEAVDSVFGLLADALASGDPASRLAGPVAHSGFRRLLD